MYMEPRRAAQLSSPQVSDPQNGKTKKMFVIKKAEKPTDWDTAKHLSEKELVFKQKIFLTLNQ